MQNEKYISSDRWDFAVFDFTSSVLDGTLSKSRFFCLTQKSCIYEGEKILCGVVYGFAFEDHCVILGEDEFCSVIEIRRTNREVVCEYRGNSLGGETACWFGPSISTVCVDGFSGSPVFSVVDGSTGYSLRFSGMVVRGGCGYLHAIKGDGLYLALKDMLLEH